MTAKCEGCDYTKSFRGWKVPSSVRRSMKKHIDKCKSNDNAIEPLEECERIDDVAADAHRHGEESCHHSCGSDITTGNNAPEFDVFADLSEAEDILAESLTASCVTYD